MKAQFNPNLTVVTLLTMMAILVTGCAYGGRDTVLPTSEGEQSLPSSDQVQQAPTETPDRNASPDSVVSSDEGLVEPSAGDDGQQVPGRVPGGEALADAQTLPEDDQVLPGEDEPVNWQVHRNDEFGFEVQYPSAYVIVEAVEPSESLVPQPLAEVLFQDRELAQGDAADLEPAQFSVRVFDNSLQLPIEKWLEIHFLIGGEEGWEITPYFSGVQMCSQFLIAPGCFIYLPKGDYVYELTPLGIYSDKMLASFRFTR